MRARDKLWVAACLLLLLFCLTMAADWQGRTVDNGGVTLYLAETGLDSDTLLTSEARTAAPVPFLLWRQQAARTAENPDFDRSAVVSLMTVYGNSAIALPTLPQLLPGSRACLLDTGTAYALFGDESPIGATVRLSGADYVISGVFDWQTGMAVCQGLPGGENLCDRITLALSDTIGRARIAEEFSLRHDLVVSAVVYPGFGDIWAELMPSRWSDFASWNAAMDGLKSQFWTQLLLPRELPQAIPLMATLGSVGWCLVGLLPLVLLLRVGRLLLRKKSHFPE